MYLTTAHYRLTPGVIQYTDKAEGQFRSAEAIRECLSKFPGIPVVKVESFDGFPTAQKIEQQNTIGSVNTIEYDGFILKLDIQLEREFDSIQDVKVAWECNIKKESGCWDGKEYQETQINLTPQFIMVQ